MFNIKAFSKFSHPQGTSTPSTTPTADKSPDFVWPQSVQQDLFTYLKPEQQDFVRPILRVLKKGAQVQLAVALIDYLETGIPEPPRDHIVGSLFYYITQHPKHIIKPLHTDN